jgi:hypothetical protein
MTRRWLLLIAATASAQVRPIRPDPQEFEKLQMMAAQADSAAKAQQQSEREFKMRETETAITDLIGQLEKIRSQVRGPVAGYKEIARFRALERRVSKLLGCKE